MAVGLYSGVSGLALGIGLYRNVSGLWGGASGLINGFGGADPYAGASLYLNFLDPVLDSRITFSRGTNATLIDSTGRLTYAPNNTITNSVGPSASTGTAVATVSGAAPDGSNAIRLSKTDATTPRYSSWITSMSVQSNTAYVVSAYFKYDGFNTTVSLEYNNTTNWGIGWVATFNITASGITANAPSLCTSGVQGVGNGWFRVWAAFTSTTVTSGSNPTVLTQITGGAGTSVLVAWGQLEAVTYQTTPSTYVATTASAYYGPRFDYDPVTLAPRGLLIEEARTNLLTYSEQFNDAAWQKNLGTIAANTTASPDGITNADTFTATAGALFHYVNRAAPAPLTGAHTYSFYVKKGTATWIFFTVNDSSINYFNLDTGLFGTTPDTCTATVAGNGWYRITVLRTLAAAAAHCGIGIAGSNGGANFTATGTESIYLYGAQLEAGSFATSYIPTVASTVTRNADVATMTGTNFSSWYNQSEGALVSEFSSFVPTTASWIVWGISDGSNNERWTAFGASNSIRHFMADGGVAQASIDVGTYSANAVFKSAMAIRINSVQAAVNGALGVEDTSATIPTVDRLGLGTAPSAAGNFLNGHIRTIAYFNTRLPNAQLQTLTAPSLATTLSLDFTSGSYNVGF